MKPVSKGSLVVALMVLTAVSAWLLLRKSNQFPQPTDFVRQSRESDVHRQPRTPTPLDQVTSGAVPRAPPKTSAPSPSPAEPPTLRELCSKDWETIATTRESDLRADLERGRRLLNIPCLLRMKNDIKAGVIRDFITDCQLELDKKDYNSIVQTCVPRLPTFRAFIIRQLRAGVSDLAQFDLSDLANQLRGGQIDLKDASESEIRRNVALADAILEKDPDFYQAYKAKLLNLLIEELKFGHHVDLATYQSLYDEMIGFRGENRADLIIEEARTLRGQDPAAAELDGIDNDLVHLPFLRLSALGDLSGLNAMARDYIAAYPNSYIGYYYLADAAWKAGDPAAAVNILKTPLGADAPDKAVLEFLRNSQADKPLDRLARMAPR